MVMMKAGGSQDSGGEKDDKKNRPALRARGGMGFKLPIPAPDLGYPATPMGPRGKAIMSRLEPEVEDVSEMDEDEFRRYNEMYNKPQMDINDAFFGPDRQPFDIIEFITNLIGRR